MAHKGVHVLHSSRCFTCMPPPSQAPASTCALNIHPRTLAYPLPTPPALVLMAVSCPGSPLHPFADPAPAAAWHCCTQS